MANILYCPTGFTSKTIYVIPPEQDAETIAEQQGWTESEWAEFDGLSYGIGTDYHSYSGAFSIVNNYPASPNTVVLSLDDAKDLARALINKQSIVEAETALGDLSFAAKVAQAALPEAQRQQIYQDVIDANNDIAINTSVRIEQVFLATTLEQVNDTVYPPAP